MSEEVQSIEIPDGLQSPPYANYFHVATGEEEVVITFCLRTVKPSLTSSEQAPLNSAVAVQRVVLARGATKALINLHLRMTMDKNEIEQVVREAAG